MTDKPTCCALLKQAESALKFYRSGFSYKQAEMSNKSKHEYDSMIALIKSAHLEGDSKLALSDFSKCHNLLSMAFLKK